jgi:hypothetical protein
MLRNEHRERERGEVEGLNLGMSLIFNEIFKKNLKNQNSLPCP